jgi:hypothetical protein
MLPVRTGRMQAVPAVLAESEDGMTAMMRPPLRGSQVSPVRVEHTDGNGWQEWGAADVRNGLPEPARYDANRAAEGARDAEVAAIVAAARARADAMPGAIPRCARCRKPAAECQDTACRARCPQHPVPLVRLSTRGILVCPRRGCAYEVQDN